jgi:hypothetical protein
MEIDQITEKRIICELERFQEESLHNPKQIVSNFAGGMYIGSLRMLQILGIKIQDWNDFE